MVNISEGETTVPLDVSVTQSGLVDPDLYDMNCAQFKILNESGSKFGQYWICYNIMHTDISSRCSLAQPAIYPRALNLCSIH